MGIRYAVVCFLGVGDCGGGSFTRGDEDYVIDLTLQCKDEGYNITTCSLPSYIGEACPYHEGYYKNCVEDKERACNESGFGGVACGVGEVAESTCPYDNGYKKCKCTPCDVFTFTYAQVTVQGYVRDGRCQPSTSACVIGRIYYSDGTCSIDVIDSKTTLGIVVYMKDANHGQVMTANSIGGCYWFSGFYYDFSHGLSNTTSNHSNKPNDYDARPVMEFYGLRWQFLKMSN